MGNSLDHCCCTKPDIRYVDVQNFQDYKKGKTGKLKYKGSKKVGRNTTDLSKKWTQYSSTQDEGNQMGN